MTASVDMFPGQLRKSGRRELLILTIAIVCYLLGLFLVTEVSRGVGLQAGLQAEGAVGCTGDPSQSPPSSQQGCGDHEAESTCVS